MVDENALGKAQYRFKQKYNLKKRSHAAMSFITGILTVVITVFIVFNFILTPYQIYGNGMEDTLKENNIAIGSKLSYKINDPKRGDVIVANGHFYRIIGLPGENVTCDSGHIIINNQLVKEEYIEDGMLTFASVNSQASYVPDDSYYVLCDNRNCYDDSRSGMFISRSDIESKILFVI